ncbi:MAG: PilW family protein [Thiotrichales bacterium]|nr:MAG: PilW family protein [Thiotrichales bacterium]
MKTIQNKNFKQQQGFSLVEMMLAMLIGIIIMGGILSVYTNTRDLQRSSEDQVNLVTDARFALETIGYDLRHAGVFGGTNIPTLISCRLGDVSCPAMMPLATGDCFNQWYLNIQQPIFGGESVVPPGFTCILNHQATTDVLVVRYADSNSVDTAALVPGTAYVRSNYLSGQLFMGTAQPVIPDDTGALTANHQLYSRAYYISDYTNTPGDGLPSLRRVDLVNGPQVQDQLILPGATNLQVQYGEDLDDDGGIDHFVNADAVSDFTKVYAVRLWVLIKTEHEEKGLNTSRTYTIAGNTVSVPNDGYRRLLISSVVKMRNMVKVDEQASSGS